MNSSKSISTILAAGLAGVAVFALANSAIVAALPAEAILAGVVSAAIIALAVFDYSRRTQPLALPVHVLRPTMPVATASGFKSGCSDHLAA